MRLPGGIQKKRSRGQGYRRVSRQRNTRAKEEYHALEKMMGVLGEPVHTSFL